jgi:large subunit ribosomal protein L1
MEILEALKELRKDDKRKFMQTLDLIVNLQKIDIRTQALNSFVEVPHPSERKVCAILSKKSKIIDTITEDEFNKYKEAKDMKKLAKKYDFFIASAPLMSKVASKFGRVLGPVGKMPSPQAGIVTKEDEDVVKAEVEKMQRMVRVRTKEKSVKLPLGREDMSDEELKENVESVVNSLINLLPIGKENIKDILIKFTMTKPVKVEL